MSTVQIPGSVEPTPRSAPWPLRHDCARPTLPGGLAASVGHLAEDVAQMLAPITP